MNRNTISNINNSNTSVLFQKDSQNTSFLDLLDSFIDNIQDKISQFKEKVKSETISESFNKLKTLYKFDSIDFLNPFKYTKNGVYEEIKSILIELKNENKITEETYNKIKASINKNYENFIKVEKDLNLDTVLLFIYKHFFNEDKIENTEIEVIIYFPRQFEALRIAYCSTLEDLITSISKSYQWKDISEGKSKASFYKTKDEKYVFKSISKNEFNMFLEIAFNYFLHIDAYLFHQMPSALMKILGVYKIKINKYNSFLYENKLEENYLILMENLNFGLDNNFIKKYDLKGSQINRYIIKNKNNLNQVLLDTNFKEDFKGIPISVPKEIYNLLLLSIYNDTLFLSKLGIVDYSLLLLIGNSESPDEKVIRLGIIDYIRKYTWDKQVERPVKTTINGFNAPTIINPTDYKNRFIKAFENYFIGI